LIGLLKKPNPLFSPGFPYIMLLESPHFLLDNQTQTH
jgi:hypothetical protein